MIYAHRQEFAEHRAALSVLEDLAKGPAAWGLPVFVIGEFLRVSTHPRILNPPTPVRDAIEAIEALLESPSVRVLVPGDQYWALLRDAIMSARARGNLVADAQIVAVCLEHGASVIQSQDQDFKRFPGIDLRRLPE